MSESQPPPSGTPLNYATATAPGGYQGPPATSDDKNMAMLIYILAIFTGFIGPLIIWLIKKDQSPFINDQGKEVLNWSITVVLAYIVCIILMFVIIGIFLMPILLLAHLILTIMGALKVKDGIAYRYPWALRLLK